MGYLHTGNNISAPQPSRQRGFTLLELLLSISLIAVLAGLSMPIYQSFQANNDLDVTINTAVQSLRRAQTLSREVSLDDNWGVYIDNTQIIIFKGISFSELGRDTGYDEVFEIPINTNISGLSEVVFEKMTGFPQSEDVGTITIGSRNIYINDKGVVSY